MKAPRITVSPRDVMRCYPGYTISSLKTRDIKDMLPHQKAKEELNMTDLLQMENVAIDVRL